MLRKLCNAYAGLSARELDRLCRLEEELPLIAQLTGEDVFIDCLARDGRVLVAAQAGQADEGSAYREKVVGQWVLPQREPAVFHAIRLMAPVRDLKAITQEDRVVRQNAVPIRGEGGRCIGVLIRERDISRDLLQEKSSRAWPAPTSRRISPSVPRSPCGTTRPCGRSTTGSRTTCSWWPAS